MTRTLTLLLPAALALAACNADSSGTAPATGTPASPATSSETATAPARPAVAARDFGTKTDLVPGVDYIEIPHGTPLEPLDGKVEVVEMFAYWCGHCAAFEPLLQAWKAGLPADVRFTPVPLAANTSDPMARVYYAAQATGQLDAVHPAMFEGLHVKRSFNAAAKPEAILGYLGKQGVDTKALGDAMNSFSMAPRLSQGLQFAERSGVEGTPTLVVNGKYRITRPMEEALRVANGLIAREREAAKNTP